MTDKFRRYDALLQDASKNGPDILYGGEVRMFEDGRVLGTVSKKFNVWDTPGHTVIFGHLDNGDLNFWLLGSHSISKPLLHSLKRQKVPLTPEDLVFQGNYGASIMNSEEILGYLPSNEVHTGSLNIDFNASSSREPLFQSNDSERKFEVLSQISARTLEDHFSAAVDCTRIFSPKVSEAILHLSELR